MFSQRDEEKYIVKYFNQHNLKSGGHLLDIGAYDGKTFSNTRQLVLQGWSGVMVEPSPSLTGVLEKLYWNNPKIKVLKVGVGLKAGILPFYNFYGDAIGTFDIAHAKLWAGKGKRGWKEIKIEVITVSDLFSRMGYNFDFINIDAEGWSVDVLGVMPLNKLKRLKMICVEFEHKQEKVLQMVQHHGFRLLHQTAENLLLVRDR